MTIEELAARQARLETETRSWLARVEASNVEWCARFNANQDEMMRRAQQQHEWVKASITNASAMLNAILDLLIKRGVLKAEEVDAAVAEHGRATQEMMADMMLAMSTAQRNNGGSA